MTPTEDITALEKALEAGPSDIADAIAWLKSGEAMMGPRTGKAVSVLLDAHAGALRDAEALRAALRVIAEVTPNGWHKDDGAHVANSFIHSARAALATNTKAQP